MRSTISIALSWFGEQATSQRCDGGPRSIGTTIFTSCCLADLRPMILSHCARLHLQVQRHPARIANHTRRRIKLRKGLKALLTPSKLVMRSMRSVAGWWTARVIPWCYIHRFRLNHSSSYPTFDPEQTQSIIIASHKSFKGHNYGNTKPNF